MQTDFNCAAGYAIKVHPCERFPDGRHWPMTPFGRCLFSFMFGYRTIRLFAFLPRLPSFCLVYFAALKDRLGICYNERIGRDSALSRQNHDGARQAQSNGALGKAGGMAVDDSAA
jgi:hypothetical protein